MFLFKGLRIMFEGQMLFLLEMLQATVFLQQTFGVKLLLMDKNVMAMVDPVSNL